MIRTILWKELRQNRLALLFLFVLSSGASVLSLFSTIQTEAGSVFVGLQVYVVLLSLANSLVLVNRIVSREYQTKTQQFLVTLPISRFVLILVKYLFGLTLILMTILTGFLIMIFWAMESETLTLRYILILLSRSLTFSFLVYSFFFFLSMLGRFQLAVCAGLLIFIASIDISTEFVFEETFPFVLLDSTFPYERETFPVRALLEALAFATICVFLAFGLALYKDGTIPDAFSQKMTHRGKIYVTGFIALGAFGFSYLDYTLPKDPYKLHGAIEVQKDQVGVSLLPPADIPSEDAQDLATRTADELEAVAKYLGVEDIPKVFITNRRDLGGDQYELGNLKDTEGLHVRINPAAEDWSEVKFFLWLTRQVLITRSKGRVELEPKMWVLDGFPYYWSDYNGLKTSANSNEVLVLRALYATNPLPGVNDFSDWLTFRERFGSDISSAVAWSLLGFLADRQGEERCRDFVSSVLGIDVKNRIGGFLEDWLYPPSTLLASKAEISFEALVSEWTKTMETHRSEYLEELEAIPKLQGGIEFAEVSPKTRRVRYNLKIDPSPTDDARYSLLYYRLPPFDKEVPPYRIKRDDCPYKEGESEELFESFSIGDRLFWTLAYRYEPLDCEIITGWKRWTVE